MDINFISPGYIGRSVAIDGQEMVNWYAEVSSPAEAKKSTVSLIPTPGLKLFVNDPDGLPILGMYQTSTGRMFYVSGRNLYEATITGAKVPRGTLVTKTGRVSFADNGDGQAPGHGLFMVDGLYGYMLNMSTGIFEQISDPAFKSATHCCFIDGRFLINENNSQKFWYSDLYDGLNWNDSNFAIPRALRSSTDTDALNFASAEGTPDNLEGIATINNELWLIGEQSTEVWYDSGSADAPYQRVHGAFFNNGTIAPYSIATNGSNIFWLGSSAQGHGQVWTATSYQPQKISTNSIDHIIEKISDITDAIGICYTQEGHNFYLLIFPKGNKTLCYDLSTGFWHERGYWDTHYGVIGRHRMNAVCFFNGKNYCGDYQNGNIYEIDLDTYTDNGDIIRRVRTGPHIHQDRKRLFFHEFEVDIERGVGLQTGQGIEPYAFLQWSDDGGMTWSHEYWDHFGRVGKYKTRLHWHRLGFSRDRVFRITVADPNKLILIAARADITKEA